MYEMVDEHGDPLSKAGMNHHEAAAVAVRSVLKKRVLMQLKDQEDV